MSSVRLTFALAALFFVLACTPSDAPQKSRAEPADFCAMEYMLEPELTSASCQHALLEGSLRLFSSQPHMPEETSIQLAAELPSGWQILHAELRGDSMYMGRIPVLFQIQYDMVEQASKDTQIWTAPFRLGACVTNPMRWRLQIHIQNDADEREILDVTFDATPL